MMPNCRPFRQLQGFTLIELLVVVFLIGLISGFAVLSVSSRGEGREITEELKQLQYRLNLAIEESVIQGRPLGVKFEEGEYEFLITHLAKWSEVSDNRALRQHSLLYGWRFELRLGSKKIPLQVPEIEGEPADPVPQIVFYSSGEVDPFELVVIDSENSPKYRIWYGEDGVITLEPIEPDQY